MESTWFLAALWLGLALLEELRPRALRGYGPVAPAAAEQLEATVAELRAALHQMLELLDHGTIKAGRGLP